MTELDVADVDDRQVARVVKTAVTPRPIAWTSTVSDAGVDNPAPFSSYNYLSTTPPVLVVNTSKKEGGRLKDTARNATVSAWSHRQAYISISNMAFVISHVRSTLRHR